MDPSKASVTDTFEHLFFYKSYVFVYLLESPCRGDSNKYTIRMFSSRIKLEYQ